MTETDTLEQPRRRGPGSLPFMQADAKPVWQQHQRLAVIAEKSKLTEREADVLLLWRGYDMTPNEVAEALDMKREHFWRHRRHINTKLISEYGDLEYEVEVVKALAQDEKRDVIQCQKNSRGSSRTPVYFANYFGVWRTWTTPTLVLPMDLTRPYVQPIDIV